jgi:L-fuculose-phosphate aldolase
MMQPFPTEGILRQEMIRVCQRLYQKNFVSASDGNLSVRLSSNRLLITPSGFSKGDLEARWLLIVDMNGKLLRGSRGPRGEELKLTTELRLHLEVYRQRPDVNAVLHAHPPVATGFSLAGVSLAGCLLPEVVYTLGAIPTTRFAAPTTEEVPDSVRELIQSFDALVLDRHGALTVGKDLWEAYYKLEKLEHTALVMLTAYQLGGVREMTTEQRQKVVEVGGALGIREEAMAACKVDSSGKAVCSIDKGNGNGSSCGEDCTSSNSNESHGTDPATARDTVRKIIMQEMGMS